MFSHVFPVCCQARYQEREIPHSVRTGRKSHPSPISETNRRSCGDESVFGSGESTWSCAKWHKPRLLAPGARGASKHSVALRSFPAYPMLLPFNCICITINTQRWLVIPLCNSSLGCFPASTCQKAGTSLHFCGSRGSTHEAVCTFCPNIDPAIQRPAKWSISDPVGITGITGTLQPYEDTCIRPRRKSHGKSLYGVYLSGCG